MKIKDIIKLLENKITNLNDKKQVADQAGDLEKSIELNDEIEETQESLTELRKIKKN